MKAFGEGTPVEVTGLDALDVAKAATPAAAEVDAEDPSGLKAGQTINITPDDTGKVPVTGVLVGLAPDRISIWRSDLAWGTSWSTSRAPALPPPVYSDISPFNTGTQPPPTLARMPSAARRAEQASRLGRPISTPCVMS